MKNSFFCVIYSLCFDEKIVKLDIHIRAMFLLGVLALGLVESTSPNAVNTNEINSANALARNVDMIWTNNSSTSSDTQRIWMLGEGWTCSSWRPTQHLYYQLANGLFFIAFLAPNVPCGMLWLRCLVIVGCIMNGLWGWLITCTIDAVVWSGLFIIVNSVYVIALLCKLRPVKFDKEIEAVSIFIYLFLNKHISTSSRIYVSIMKH